MTNIDWPIDKAERREPPFMSVRLHYDPDYVKKHVSEALIKGLTDILMKKPYDPIEHLACFLRKYHESLKQKEAVGAIARRCFVLAFCLSGRKVQLITL